MLRVLDGASPPPTSLCSLQSRQCNGLWLIVLVTTAWCLLSSVGWLVFLAWGKWIGGKERSTTHVVAPGQRAIGRRRLIRGALLSLWGMTWALAGLGLTLFWSVWIAAMWLFYQLGESFNHAHW